MALQTLFPVALSQRTVVSRWLVMPMQAMSVGERPLFSKTSSIAFSSVARISMGSCSTQPGRG